MVAKLGLPAKTVAANACFAIRFNRDPTLTPEDVYPIVDKLDSGVNRVYWIVLYTVYS